ncbi:heme-dependent oxidative N-demethylase subunit alpha family protein [Polynucleobacter sp. HIN7]|uniref:heme-dependent oxidative N-demethylase subunit alpha family protein n=1 Tax=Polynucleobacter sp. HIN7 TaxID=3047866 RepID=UPI002572918B|nr:heme-dependent oxidative N-demethylase subunit alpha family protein [Polynucleobacter sp. HIN7]
MSASAKHPAFVVEVPYTTSPKMSRYAGPLMDAHPDPRYLEAKNHELALLGSELCAQQDAEQTRELISKAASDLNLPEARTIRKIEDLALCINEDVALLEDDILTAICFCFPSSWIPAKRLGMPLAQIHHPVADGERLVQASPKIAHVMSDPQQGSFRRFVWTISNSPELSQHPSRKSNATPQRIDDLYYRLETQTTMPINTSQGRASLFLVKVEVCPLMVFWQNPEQRAQICASIQSMSEAVLEYKNLHSIKALLLQNG